MHGQQNINPFRSRKMIQGKIEEPCNDLSFITFFVAKFYVWKEALNKQMFSYFNAASSTLHELHIFYCCKRLKIAIKALLYYGKYFLMV
jgi:hypothetical protein